MSSVGRYAMGERLGGFIYGTIVILAVLVGGRRRIRTTPARSPRWS